MQHDIDRILHELRDVHQRRATLPARGAFGVKADLAAKRLALHAEARRIARGPATR